jgi:hypothetical protein
MAHVGWKNSAMCCLLIWCTPTLKMAAVVSSYCCKFLPDSKASTHLHYCPCCEHLKSHETWCSYYAAAKTLANACRPKTIPALTPGLSNVTKWITHMSLSSCIFRTGSRGFRPCVPSITTLENTNNNICKRSYFTLQKNAFSTFQSLWYTNCYARHSMADTPQA